MVFRVAFFLTYELLFHFCVVFMELHSQRSLHTHWALVQVTDFFPRWSLLCFPGGAAVRNPPANTGDTRGWGFGPWVGKIPWNRKWQATPVFLPGKFHGQRSWWATVHGVTKSQTRLSE